MKNQDDSLGRPNVSHQLPFCPLSTQCLLYEDRLNSPDDVARTYFEGGEDTREERFIEQLRIHVPTCSTCQTLLAEVRQQRAVIRDTLRTGERKVPTTAPRIIAAIHQEAASTPPPQPSMEGHERYQDGQPIFPYMMETPLSKRRRGTWRDIFSIAVAATLVLATLGVIGRLVLLHSSAGSATVSAGSISNSIALTPSASWSSVVLTYILHNKTVIANYDPLSGQSVPLAEFAHSQVVVDGAAHNGHEVLYHVFDGTQTRYYLYPQTQQPIYTTAGQGGSAIWSSGSGDSDHYLFISTPQGIAQINMSSHVSHILSLPLAATQALFYHNGYLYYVQDTPKTPYSGMGTLYRVNIANSKQSPTPVTPCPQAANFWLSLAGATVYYQCPKQGQNALYAVNGDGTNAHLIRSDAGQTVGYAADNSLLVLQENNARYQVVQLGASAQQDRVLLSDVAPGSVSVYQNDVAVAPYGYMLLAKGVYANNVEKLWYGDLMTKGIQQVQLPNGVHDVKLIGWDRLIPSSAAG